MKEKQLTLIEHLTELRARIIISLVAITIGSIISYYFINQIVDIIIHPADNLHFIYLNPADLFLAYMKTSIVTGLVLASPIIMYQVWCFVFPGISKQQRIYIATVVSLSALLFCLGAVFAYSVIIPFALEFFTNISRSEVQPLFSFASYSGFIGSLLLSFGVAFQLPTVVTMLTHFNLITPSTLKRSRKIVVLLVLIVGAILTPPDVVSQLLLAFPLYILFELSIIVSSIISSKKKSKSA